MNITLIQRSRSWIWIQIETDSVCLQISASSVFDLFEELYIWLGQIRTANAKLTVPVIKEITRANRLFTLPKTFSNC